MNAEIVLGFDCRLSIGGASGFVSPGWSGEPCPSTVDRNIWWVPEFLANEDAQPTKNWRGPNVFLWEKLNELESVVLKSATQAPVSIIAITVVRNTRWDRFQEMMKTSHEAGLLYGESATPSVLTDDWVRMGYDTGDGYLYSALTNMGLSSLESDKYHRHARILNSHLLFSQIIEAERFADWAEPNVAGHRPLLIFGVYERPTRDCGGC